MKKGKGKFLLVDVLAVIFAVTLVLNPFSATFAAAQEEKARQETVQEEKTRGEYELETMTVTAQKREENVQDVPISMDVFSDIQLEDAGIENTLDLTRFTPNVYLKHAEPENTIIIRGVTSFHSSIYSPTGFYVDDVNFPLQLMHNTELFDVERIEVLKGPQGTLYGRNSESGVINIITKQPDNELRGKIFGEYGSYDTGHGSSPSYRAGGSISGPIVRDKLYLGLAGQYKESDGYVENEYNNDDEAAKIEHKNLRSTLRWTPTDRWDISFIADVLDTDDGYALYRLNTGPNKTDRYKISADYPDNYIKQDGNGQTMRFKYEGDSFNFLSVSGVRYYKRDLGGDRDVTDLPLGYSCFAWKDRQLSQELRISSPENSGSFEWLVGVYGFKEEVDTRINLNMFGMGPIWDHITDIDVSGYAAFGQGTYTLFDRLHLTAGLRFDHHDLEGELEGRPSMMTPAGQNLEKKLDYDEILPKLSAAYDFTDDIMIYISASKGYLIGGYNYVSAFTEEAFTYDPEYTWNYEVGMKTAWLDNKLLANAAIFYIDMDDKQVFEIDTSIPIPGAQHIRNAAEAHSQGIELELQARPVQGLDLFAGFGYTEAKYDKWIATEAGGVKYDYKDKYLTYFPKYTYNLGVQYRHKSGLLGRADLHGVGDIYCDSKNILKQGSYQTVNLRLGYEGERFDFILWGKNVFDEEYFKYMTHYGPDKLVVDGEPLTFGATVTYRF